MLIFHVKARGYGRGPRPFGAVFNHPEAATPARPARDWGGVDPDFT